MYLETNENKKKLQSLLTPSLLFFQKLKSFEQTYHLQKIHLKNLGDSKFDQFLENEIQKCSQKISLFFYETFEQMVKTFLSKFSSPGNENYRNFLRSSLDKHQKEWKYLCYKSDKQANEYFFKKLDEVKAMLIESEEDLTPLQVIDDAPKLVLDLKVKETDTLKVEQVVEPKQEIIEEAIPVELDQKENNNVEAEVIEISENDAQVPQNVIETEEPKIDKVSEVAEPEPIIEPELSVTSEDNSVSDEDEYLDDDFPDIMTPEYFSQHLKIKSKTFRAFLGPDKQRKNLSLTSNSPIDCSSV